MSANSSNQFEAIDYVVFMVLLLSNAGIGLFYAIKDRKTKNENTQEYLLGGRKQRILPVGLSLGVTFVSSSTLLGTPVDVYYFNTMYIYFCVGVILATFAAATVFIPFFYRLGITSTFQYLELRFNRGARLCGVVALVIQMILYMALVLYGPSLALSAMTGWNLESCMTGMGIVVTFYTTLGGMKTVLWTDSLQTITIFAGLFAIFIKGSMEVGGLSEAWRIATDKGRVDLTNFSFEPSVRHSVWSVAIGGAFFWMAMFGTSQAQVQRCLSTSSIRASQWALLVALPVVILLIAISSLNGVLMFVYYADCDPVKMGRIVKKDQLVPLYFLDILGHIKGLSGLFIASVFASSLSSISSGVNAISAIMYEEVKLIQRFKSKLTTKTSVIFAKLISIMTGVAVIGACFAVQNVDLLLESAIMVLGVVNGPVFYLFVGGMFFPWINSWGAISGFITAITFSGWVSVGKRAHNIKTVQPLPTIVTSGCNISNITTTTSTLASTTINATIEAIMNQEEGYQGVEVLYTMSYMYLTVAGLLVGIGVGLFVSFITGFTKLSELDPKLVLPVFHLLSQPTTLDHQMNHFPISLTKTDVKQNHSRTKTIDIVECRLERKELASTDYILNAHQAILYSTL